MPVNDAIHYNLSYFICSLDCEMLLLDESESAEEKLERRGNVSFSSSEKRIPDGCASEQVSEKVSE